MYFLLAYHCSFLPRLLSIIFLRGWSVVVVRCMWSVRAGLCLRKGNFRFSRELDASSLANLSLTLPTSALNIATRYDFGISASLNSEYLTSVFVCCQVMLNILYHF